ncbi:MAG TPA: hypothetical protein VF157_05530 [Chloroflexota bacterium]
MVVVPLAAGLAEAAALALAAGLAEAAMLALAAGFAAADDATGADAAGVAPPPQALSKTNPAVRPSARGGTVIFSS